MTVGLEITGPFAVITLNRPDKLNALSFEVLRKLDARLDEVASSSVRALIVTGAGNKAFCAGADIEELRHRQLMEQKRGAELGQAVFEKIARLPVISIAAINGYAFGGGLELALACTLRIVSANAKMGLPEIRLGLIPGYGGTQRLPRLIGEAHALDIILTGRTIDAAEAERIGLANRLVDTDVVAAAMAYASEITRFSVPSIGFARDAVRRALDLPVAEGLKVEADLSTLAYRTADAEEGLAAFVEKRKPEFKDA
ncbi:enoyl-CoA hydratase/isomerase family protein [Nitratireductor luteus]|uniref:enoyl-CoA hydratase/isomerase family protein n=1 Tax=Nitratireductor luteus TaxID=2976980 RepID=UPI00223EAEA6|nr:enoyl-CoA hydratase-related protein [Nitratireductor luteus]